MVYAGLNPKLLELFKITEDLTVSDLPIVDDVQADRPKTKTPKPVASQAKPRLAFGLTADTKPFTPAIQFTDPKDKP